MTELRQNFSLIAGDTTDVDYGIAPTPDPPFDLAQTQMTWTAYPSIRGIPDKTAAAVTKSLAAGGIEIEDAATYTFVVHLKSSDTIELDGNYYYEIVILNPLDIDPTHRSTPTIGNLTVINTANPINIVALKSMFVETQQFNDGLLQTALDEAGAFVDDSWANQDMLTATYCLAAHFLFSAVATSGTGGQIVSQERIGQISITYAATPVGKTGDYPSLSATSYGLMYLALMRRNSPAILIV